MVSWAPSRDKRVELFSRASVPPAIVSKDDREWNDVLPPIVRGEHTDDGAFLGRRRAVPLRFRHSTTFPGWFAAHWATNSSGKKRTETEARLGVPGLDKLGGAPPSSPLGLRSDTPEGATGVAKLFGQISKYWYGPNPPRLLFTITRAIECEATKIRHTCGNCATICWSRQLAGLTLAVSTRAASLQVLASTLQHHCVKLIQQLVEFDKHLAAVECRCARRFQMFKLGEPPAEGFD